MVVPSSIAPPTTESDRSLLIVDTLVIPDPMSTLALLCFLDQGKSTMLFFVGARLSERLLLLVSLEPASDAVLRPKTVGKRFRSNSSLSSVMWSLMMFSFCRTEGFSVSGLSARVRL